MTSPFFPVAVPSWIVPGTAADSARLLRGLPSLTVEGCRIAEIGLCCFEGQSSLDMPDSEYPSVADLDAASLTLHVHLPLDLCWADTVAPSSMALALMRKFSALGVTRAVLHPPPGDLPPETPPRLALLQRFVGDWQAAGLDSADLLLENDAYCSADEFLTFLSALPVRACVDVAHLMAYNQQALLTELPPERVGLLHWSAPGPAPGKDAHKPLTHLTPEQRRTAGHAARQFAHALPLVEVFDWDGVCESLPELRSLYGF